MIRLQYIADENGKILISQLQFEINFYAVIYFSLGFQPQGDHLPTPPPIPPGNIILTFHMKFDDIYIYSNKQRYNELSNIWPVCHQQQRHQFDDNKTSLLFNHISELN